MINKLHEFPVILLTAQNTPKSRGKAVSAINDNSPPIP